jgi:hypothetical protein
MNPTGPYMELIEPDFFDHNDGGFNAVTGEYTIPSNGIYRIYVEIPNTLNYTMGINIFLETYNGAWTSEYLSASAPNSLVHRYTAGQKIRLKIGCGTKFTNYTVPLVIDSTKFTFALKKF